MSSSPKEDRISSSNTSQPIATRSVLNQSTDNSIFQTCVKQLKKLYRVPGLNEILENSKASTEQNNTMKTYSFNPVDFLWSCYRQGYTLCFLYETLRPNEKKIQPKISQSMSEQSIKKAYVYQFLTKCKMQLNYNDEILFSTSDLYRDDTNSFVKVLRLVDILLEEIENKGLLTPLTSTDETTNDNTNNNNLPIDNRSKVVMELLKTERKYIADLETLQEYKKQCEESEYITDYTTRCIFANLNELLDFQRRVLINVETNCALETKEQRFGQMFLSMETGFNIYETFCGNYQQSIEVSILEKENLKEVKGILEPSYELPSFLIKPIQRVCKYPLLMRELIKYTNKDEHPYYDELIRGAQAIEKVASNINETMRIQANNDIIKELKEKIVNIDIHDYSKFGRLIMNSDFVVIAKDHKEKKMKIFMFDNIILCCREIITSQYYSSSISSKTSLNFKTNKENKRISSNSLEVRGQIQTKNLVKVTDKEISGDIFLRLYWKSQEMQILLLKCLNEEQANKWKSTINEIIVKRKASSQAHTSSDNNTLLNLNSLDINSSFESRVDSRSSSNGTHNKFTPIMSRVSKLQEENNITQRGRSASTPDINNAKEAINQINNRRETADNIARRKNSEISTSLSNTDTPSIKIKAKYDDGIFLLLVPLNISFEELLSKISKKFWICTRRKGLSNFNENNSNNNTKEFRLRYRDDDNDLITIAGNDDLENAFDYITNIKMKENNNIAPTIEIYVD